MIPEIMVAFYAVLCTLSIWTALLILIFIRKLPKDFAALGRIMKCFGCCLKGVPRLLVLVHYVMAILVLAEAFIVAGGACKDNEDMQS